MGSAPDLGDVTSAVVTQLACGVTTLGVDILVFVRGGGQPPVPAQHVSVEGRS